PTGCSEPAGDGTSRATRPEHDGFNPLRGVQNLPAARRLGIVSIKIVSIPYGVFRTCRVRNMTREQAIAIVSIPYGVFRTCRCRSVRPPVVFIIVSIPYGVFRTCRATKP